MGYINRWRSNNLPAEPSNIMWGWPVRPIDLETCSTVVLPFQMRRSCPAWSRVRACAVDVRLQQQGGLDPKTISDPVGP